MVLYEVETRVEHSPIIGTISNWVKSYFNHRETFMNFDQFNYYF